MLYYAMICHAMSCYNMPWYAMICHAIICHDMSCYDMPYYAMLCYAMLCYTMLRTLPCSTMNKNDTLCLVIKCYVEIMLCYVHHFTLWSFSYIMFAMFRFLVQFYRIWCQILLHIDTLKSKSMLLCAWVSSFLQCSSGSLFWEMISCFWITIRLATIIGVINCSTTCLRMCLAFNLKWEISYL